MRGFVFDYGGTLSITGSLAGSLATVLDHAQADEIGARIEERIFALYTPDQEEQPPWEPVWREAFEHFGVTFDEALGVAHLEAFVAEGVPYDYTVPVLEHLRTTSLTVGLLSNTTGPVELFTEGLRSRGLDGYFDAAEFSCGMGYRKPGRRAFEIIAESLGEPLEALYMVGDSEIADIVGGNAAGMTTILVHDAIERPASAADHVVHRDGLRDLVVELTG